MDAIEGMRQMEDNSVDMTLTSPPFKDEDVVGDYWMFYDAWYREACRVTSKVMIVIQSPNRINELISCYPVYRLMIWYKGFSLRHARYNPMLVYAFNGYKPNRWIYSDVIGELSVKNPDKTHKYEDPLRLYGTLVKMFKDCQTILDPFIGSGTTAEACIQLGKSYIGFELNPAYVDIAERRLRNVQLRMV
jgi:site-specific DNA-methyltransferase (adenine-specific)